MTSHSKAKEICIFLIILVVASYFRFHNLSIAGNSIHFGMVDFWSMPLVSAIAGILTVAGLYLLAKQLFNWQIASLSSFLLAVSFWHVNISRSGLKIALIPLILVFSFYFLWKGLKKSSLVNFLIAGAIGGLGFYADISFLAAPLIALVLFWNYWSYLRQDFSHSKYEFAKIRLLKGFVVLALSAIIVALPFIYNFWIQGQLLTLKGPEIFSQNQPHVNLWNGIVKTLGMFWFFGDSNPSHGFPNMPILSWPLGALFLIGFVNEFIHWVRRKHGHFSTVHTLIFSWFFLMLIGSFISLQVPDALITAGAIPIVMLLAGRGLWWIFDKINGLSKLEYPEKHIHSTDHFSFPVALVLLVFISTIGFYEYWNFFNVFIKK